MESWDTVVAVATEKETDQKLGESPISSEKMPESGDERTIRPNESQGQAEKNRSGPSSARSTFPQKNVQREAETVAQK